MKYLIYIVAFLEGWTTLSVEIVALRKFTPIIGSNSISTSIILGVILLALSYGYYIGGKISANHKKLEKKLVINLILASIYYFFITFIFSEIVLQNLLNFTGNYFLSILLSSIILFFIPVFLASQTIPLLSELLKGNNGGEKMGKLLFFSTVGSFLGSISTSIVLFPLIGVFKTAIISSIILTFCAFILSIFFIKNNEKLQVISLILFSFFLYFIFSFNANIINNYKFIIFEKANSYHNIKIYDVESRSGKKRIFSLDGGNSSGINLDDKKSFFNYIKEVENKVIEIKAKNILVIGAAGFTFPNDISKFDFVENIDVVDIDSELKDITEKYFIQEKLSEKIKFFPEPSRFFINKKINLLEKKYDLILVDAYSGKSLPPQVLTKEFFTKLKSIGENIFLNIIIDRDLKSDFSKNLLTTLNNSFNNIYLNNVNIGLGNFTNMIFSNKKFDKYIKNNFSLGNIYTDNRNSIELDLFELNKIKYGKKRI